MKHDSNGEWYTAKAIKKLLGVSSGQLFHWGRSWSLFSPKIKAKGRAFKDQYSFRNLLEIALIKELYTFGFELSNIQSMINSFDESHASNEKKCSEIWARFKSLQNQMTGEENYYEKIVFLVIKKEDKRFRLNVNFLNQIDEGIFCSIIHDEFVSQLHLNLSKIHDNLERKIKNR